MRDVDAGLSSWSCLEETVICKTEDSTMEVGVELGVQLDHSVIGLLETMYHRLPLTNGCLCPV